MSTKNDRKSLLRSSIKNEADSIDKRFPQSSVDMRYEAAEGALEGRPLGLVGPRVSINSKMLNLRAEIETKGEGRSILRVQLTMVHDNPMNARHIYDPEAVKILAASLATRGQLVPAPAVPHPDLPGHVILIDGHYRKRALIAAGKTEIECVIQDVSNELDMYRMSFLINEERNAQSPLDNALAWQKLLNEKKVQDGEGIADLSGISPAAVTKTMALLKLPETALIKIRERPVKFGVAIGYEIYRISKLLTERELLDLMDKVVEEDLSSRALEQMRVKFEEAKPRKKKDISRQYKIKQEGLQIGSLKEWDTGRVAFDVVLLDPKDRAALIMELRERFGIKD